MEPTGEADTESWKKSMRSAVSTVADRCLQLTAAFEGHGFGRVQGNFDGAGIRWFDFGRFWWTHATPLKERWRGARVSPGIYGRM